MFVSVFLEGEGSRCFPPLHQLQMCVLFLFYGEPFLAGHPTSLFGLKPTNHDDKVGFFMLNK